MKACKGDACKGKLHPFDDFPNSPHTEDGKLNYCSGCWSKIMKKARAKRKAQEDAGLKPVRRGGRPKKNGVNGHADAALVNKALDAANNAKVRILVEADDGEKKEFRNERKALKQAMTWKLDGYKVRIWREVEFILDARIVG